MPVDPQIQPMIDASVAMMALDMSAVTPDMLRESAIQTVVPFALPDIAAISDHSVPGPAAAIPVRLYRPQAEGVLPGLLFLHGGGWVMGTIEQYEHFARELALKSGCAVLSVEYRLAPEHPYPAAIDDCYAVLEWLTKSAGQLGIDPLRLAIAGDSAGGNLAAAVALLARDRRGPVLRHQLLIYPVTNRTCDTVSYHQNDRYLLTPDMMRWFWRQYLGDRGADETPLAAPAEFSDLAGLPPATVITAEYDPLRDEGEDYALALTRAGVATEFVRAPGMIHGFMVMSGMVDAAARWLEHAAARVAAAVRD